MSRKIYIVDDHPVMRQGLAALVQSTLGMDLCGEAPTAEEALEQIIEMAPDLVMVDLALPGMNGLELIKHLRARRPEVNILVVSAHDESLYAERALRAGARGYIMKHAPADEIREAIRQVIRGGLVLSETLRERLLRHYVGREEADGTTSPIEQFSDRELEVFTHLGRGLSTRQIAEAMGVSPKTVETYRANIKEKLAVDDSSELIRLAVLWVERSTGGALW